MINRVQKYYDYDMEITSKPSQYRIDSIYGQFHVYESGNTLVVELAENTEYTREKFKEDYEEERNYRGYDWAEHRMFECISANGLDFIRVDEIGAMSEAPAFVDVVYLPDWIVAIKRKAKMMRTGKWTNNWMDEIDWDRSRVWSAIEYYQIESPLDHIARTGKAVFRLAK